MNRKQAVAHLKAELRAFKGTKKEWYNKVYLFSGHWRELRERALRAGDYTCAHCDKRDHLQVHHLRYRNIYDVGLVDLLVLCGPCHKAEHANPKTKKPIRAKQRSAKPPRVVKFSLERGVLIQQLAKNLDDSLRELCFAKNRHDHIFRQKNITKLKNRIKKLEKRQQMEVVGAAKA